MGPRTGLDVVWKRKIPSPRQESNLDHPIVQPISSRYTDCTIPLILIIFYSKTIEVYLRDSYLTNAMDYSP
jgi:hypothetical protein